MAKLSIERELRRAKTSERKGLKDEARAIYRAILERFPANVRAQEALAVLDAPAPAAPAPFDRSEVEEMVALHREGKFDLAAEKAEKLVELAPGSVQLWTMLAAASHGIGRLDRMEFGLRKATELNPGDHKLKCNLGVALYLQGRHEEAIEAYREALSIKPDYVEALSNLGAAQNEAGSLEDAIVTYRRAIEMSPQSVEPHNNLGAMLIAAKRYDEAIAPLEAAIRVKPDFRDSYKNLGVALKELGRTEEAEAKLRKAIELSPNYVEAYSSLGNLLSGVGRYEEAIASFREAIRIDPRYVPAYFNYGIALRGLGRLQDALNVYNRALQIDAENPDLLINLGGALQAAGQLEQALNCFDKALVHRPDSAAAHNNRGEALIGKGRLPEAVEALEKAVALAPENDAIRMQKFNQQMQLAQWEAMAEFDEHRETLGTRDVPVPPFTALPFEDNPERQRDRARLYSSRLDRFRAPPLPAWSKQREGRLRVGFFSADFRDHPMLLLMIGLFKTYDAERLEVFIFSFGPPTQSELREELKGYVDHFVDISAEGDREAVEIARSHRLDVAIDMMGYTRHARTELFALRVAPVQVNFLGFPSSMGADFIDYIVSDEIVIPESERRHYDEKLLRMPITYYPYDREQPIAETGATRSDHGLPEDGFVFCCFNQSYKIGPREFDIWMRLLTKVEDSVLWLYVPNDVARDNFRRHAEDRGVDPGRIVFAGRTPHEQHLERHRLADLFLDTFHYNAHTTGADALWTGLPLVTLLGRQFAARVGGTLLNAIGLPDLVAETEEAYEALALDLATDREKLAGIRARLAENRLTTQLFDTKKYSQDFASLLEQADARKRAELPG